MTNGEKIQTILDVDRDCTEVHGENGTMTFTVTQDFWNARYEEPTTKNDLGVDCISREDVLQILWDYDYANENALVIKDIKALPSATPQEPRIDFEELKRKILMEVDGGTDDAWLAYGEVCNRISNSIDEFVADMRGTEE